MKGGKTRQVVVDGCTLRDHVPHSHFLCLGPFKMIPFHISDSFAQKFVGFLAYNYPCFLLPFRLINGPTFVHELLIS